MDGPEVMFDGMTVNLAGELLEDEPKQTRWLRARYFGGYYRALEDFAFGAIFGGKIITTRPVDAVLDGNPGERLLIEDLKHKHERRRPVGPASGPEALLDDGSEREELTKRLGYLGPVVHGASAVYWKGHMVREVVQYLGCDETLRRPGGKPGDYKYVGRGRLWPDQPLQNAVPRDYVESMVNAIKNNLPGHPGVQIADVDALRDFVTTNVVAHLVLYYWRNRVGDAVLDKQKSLFIQHATRQSLVEIEQELFEVQNLVMPGLLRKMISRSTSRRDLRERLISASDDPKYQPLRAALAEAARLLRTGDASGFKKVRQDVNRYIELSKSLIGRVRLSFGMAVGRKGGLYEKAIGKLVRSGAGPGTGVRLAGCGKPFNEELISSYEGTTPGYL